MALFITFGSQKGGSGKSTCTVLAAGAFSRTPFNFRVAVVDLDYQQSITALRSFDRQGGGVFPYEVFPYNISTLEARLNDLDERFDIVLLDVPGKLDKEAGEESEAARALAYTDLLLVPVPPGNFALHSTVQYIEAALSIQEAKAAAGQSMEIYAFRNLYRDHRITGRELGRELEELRELAGIGLVKEPLRRYALFESVNTIESMYIIGGSEAAHRNFVRWLNEIYSIIQKM